MPKAKTGELLGTVTGTYCPGCGSMHLPAAEWRGQIWVYCAVGATGPGDAHTAFPIREYRPTRDEIETVAPLIEAAQSEPKPEPKPSIEESA